MESENNGHVVRNTDLPLLDIIELKNMFRIEYKQNFLPTLKHGLLGAYQ